MTTTSSEDADMAEPASSSPPPPTPPPVKTFQPPIARADSPDPPWMSPSPATKRRKRFFSARQSASARLAAPRAKRRLAERRSSSSDPHNNEPAISISSSTSSAQTPPQTKRQTVAASFSAASARLVDGHSPSLEPEALTEDADDSHDEMLGPSLPDALPHPDTTTSEESSTSDTSSVIDGDETMAEQTQQTHTSKSMTSKGTRTRKSKASEKNILAKASPDKDDDDVMYPYKKVIAVWAGQYVIDWAGDDPDTGLPWKPSLQPQENFPSETPVLKVIPDKVVEAERTVALADSSGEDEDDVQNEVADVRCILDSITFPGKPKTKTFTLYLVDWEPSNGGKEVYEPEWVASQDVSAEAVEQYKAGQKRTKRRKDKSTGQRGERAASTTGRGR